MAYQKRKESATVTKATKRLNVMIKIDKDKNKKVEYGDATTNPLNVALLNSKINAYGKTITDTNGILAEADVLVNQERAQRKEIADMYSGILKGAVSKFGADSDEVEQLGGTRKSERKRPDRKPKLPAAPKKD